MVYSLNIHKGEKIESDVLFKILQDNINKCVQCHFSLVTYFIKNQLIIMAIMSYKYKLHRLLGGIGFFFKVCPKPAINAYIYIFFSYISIYLHIMIYIPSVSLSTFKFLTIFKYLNPHLSFKYLPCAINFYCDFMYPEQIFLIIDLVYAMSSNASFLLSYF